MTVERVVPERVPRDSAVLLVGPSLEAVGGVSTHLKQLLGSALADRYRFVHFQVGSEGRNEGRVGRMLRLLFDPWRLLFVTAREGPGIIHINTSMNVKGFWRDAAYLLVAKIAGCRVVYQVHGGALPGEFLAGAPWAGALLRRVVSMADAVVVLGEFQRRAYSELVPGIAVRVIPNGIEADPVTESLPAWKHGSQLHLAYVGRLVRDKGIFEMVEAVRLLVARGADVSLEIAGSGWDEDGLRSVVERNRLDGRVRFLGAVFGMDKERLFRRAHVLLLPSYHEGLPYSLLESMVNGAVPVTTPVGAVPEVIADGVHGLLVPPRDPVAIANAVERLDRDRGLLSRMAEEGRRHVLQHYTVSRLGSEFDQLYGPLR